jgi:hypothetical protein
MDRNREKPAGVCIHKLLRNFMSSRAPATGFSGVFFQDNIPGRGEGRYNGLRKQSRCKAKY